MKLSKKGSAIVKQIREMNDRNSMREKFWELNGTKMGQLLKLEKEKKQSESIKQDDVDYRAENQYAATLVNQKTAKVSDFARRNTLQQQREMMPVFSVRDKLLSIIRENRIVVIVGETGSGKTTQLTQFLHESGYTKNGMIGCTQPRRVAAVSVAKRVSEEMGCKLGDEVGYAIRFEDCTTKGKTAIKYMTDGVLLRESLNDAELDDYCAVVMDEAHERSLNTDVLFGLLKKISAKRRDLKLIITSATMNSDKFSQFFGGVPVFEIPGRTFPVQMHFAKYTADDYVDSAVQQALKCHMQPIQGDILIFMTGQEDVEATCFLLEERL